MREIALLIFTAAIPSGTWGQVYPEDVQKHTADLASSRAEYRNCIRETIVKLGEGNNEGAEIILRAAKAHCSEIEGTVRRLLAPASVSFGQAHVERVISGDRESAENIGMANLLTARSARDEAP